MTGGGSWEWDTPSRFLLLLPYNSHVSDTPGVGYVATGLGQEWSTLLAHQLWKRPQHRWSDSLVGATGAGPAECQKPTLGSQHCWSSPEGPASCSCGQQTFDAYWVPGPVLATGDDKPQPAPQAATVTRESRVHATDC